MEASKEVVQYPPEMVLVGDKKIPFAQWLEESIKARVGTSEEQAKIFKAIQKNPDEFQF